VDGRKIAGSAQRRVRASFLQHGSMPITFDYEALALATRVRDSEALKREMAGMAEILAARPGLDQLRGAFIRAFQDYFSIEFCPGTHRPVDPVIA
jgi:lipoate-protein ligase A